MTTIYRENVSASHKAGKGKRASYKVRYWDEQTNTHRVANLTAGDMLILERTGEVKINAD